MKKNPPRLLYETLISILFIMCIQGIFSQKSVSGTVTDTNNTPLPGANIVEKGTTNGVTADFDGNFYIDIADGNATIVASYIEKAVVDGIFSTSSDNAYIAVDEINSSPTLP